MKRQESSFHFDQLSTTEYLARTIITELSNKGQTITIAEGCTGGSILDAITAPGATRVFHVGCVAYNQEAKIRLGVSSKTIKTYGEYSPEVAREMAGAIRTFRNDTLAIATIGEINPTNLLQTRWAFIGFSTKDKSWGQTIILPPLSKKSLKTSLAEACLSQVVMWSRNHSHHENSNYTFPISETLMEGETNLELIIKAQEIIQLLTKKHWKLSTMESCTGGAIANALTNISGASKVIDTAWIAYDENVKRQLGVPWKTMTNGNVYSLEVAGAMAEAVQQQTGTDIAIGTTGVMNTPDTRGFHTDHLPGTIYIAIKIQNILYTQKLLLQPRDRNLMKQEITLRIFDLLLQLLNNKYQHTQHTRYF